MNKELEKSHRKVLEKLPNTLPKTWSHKELDDFWTHLDIEKSERIKLSIKCPNPF